MQPTIITSTRRAARALVAPALAASLFFTGCLADGDADSGATPFDDEFPVSAGDPLFDGAPGNQNLPDEGKADAVYPRQWSDMVALQSPVKSQGSRGVCSIFSSTALMEHLYIKEGTLLHPDFSEQYMQWSSKVEQGAYTYTEGSNNDANLTAAFRFGMVLERDWPYQPFRWSTLEDPACTGETQPVRCYTNGEPPASALAAKKWKLPRGKYLNSTVSSIKAHLTGKQTAVSIGLTFFYQAWNHRLSALPVNNASWREGVVRYPNAKDKELSLVKRAGHAIVIVGWDDDKEVQSVDENGVPMVDGNGEPVMEKGFWIFKNSWGTASFGVENPYGAGYGYLSMKYVSEYANAFVAEMPKTVTLPAESCDNGIDDDLDDTVDCADSDCAADAACQPAVEPDAGTEPDAGVEPDAGSDL